ncbi:MAG: hypothetical protein M3O22_04605 [Pseudomonadota bacterium]|nr:hypothetical protein [Pseudomonadota bacterium]
MLVENDFLPSPALAGLFVAALPLEEADRNRLLDLYRRQDVQPVPPSALQDESPVLVQPVQSPRTDRDKRFMTYDEAAAFALSDRFSEPGQEQKQKVWAIGGEALESVKKKGARLKLRHVLEGIKPVSGAHFAGLPLERPHPKGWIRLAGLTLEEIKKIRRVFLPEKYLPGGEVSNWFYVVKTAFYLRSAKDTFGSDRMPDISPQYDHLQGLEFYIAYSQCMEELVMGRKKKISVAKRWGGLVPGVRG